MNFDNCPWFDNKCLLELIRGRKLRALRLFSCHNTLVTLSSTEVMAILRRNGSVTKVQTLIDLTEHPLSLPFLDPVDDTITSYHNVIGRPMDFATMAHNINFKFRGDTTKGLPAKKFCFL